MNIVSYQYLFFLIIVFLCYYLLNDRYKKYLLCFASLAFYAIGQPVYVILLLLSVSINYLVGLSFSTEKSPKRLIFYLSLIFNIGLLVYFKYLGYWLSLINPSLQILQPKTVSTLSNLILPIGISFYTFNAIGYTIDVYLKVMKPERNIMNYITYQAFFPQVLSGPVARGRLLIPQINKTHHLDYGLVVSGLRLILLGYFKKLVIANGLRPYVDAVFNNYTFHNGSTLYFAAFIYFIEVYADFSGYTDIALGTARLFGFDLINNFNKPFTSKSVTDFWRRWHISLSSWCRDYLYYPILYTIRQYQVVAVFAATLITFLVIGFWHGPRLTFAIFGISQFILILLELYISKLVTIHNKKLSIFISIFQHVFTILLMSLFMIFLRLETTEQIFGVFSRIFTSPGKVFLPQEAVLLFGSFGFLLLLIAEIISGKQELTVFISERKRIVRWFVYIFMISLILVCGVFDDNTFIYYQF